MKTFDESKSFCTCPPSGNQVDGLPLASLKDAASASWPFSGRACMCETRRVFQVLMKFDMQRYLIILKIQILCTLRLRFELVNDQNHKTDKSYTPAKFSEI